VKKVILYGALGKRFGKYHSLAVKNAAEALRALRANYRDFESFMIGADREGMGFRVFVGREDLEHYQDIHNPAGETEVIRIVPVIMGSKSPFFRFLTGAVLIAAAFIIPGAQNLGYIGAAMIVGGVTQLLTKPPAQPSYQAPSENKESFIFSGPANTSVQGSIVPVVYGRMIVGSKVISAGIEAYEL
jgi:predicted phage tail protein